MKTQISRDSFRPGRRYSGVYQQQGRMFPDYDLNELVDLVKARLVAALRDAVDSGAPRDRGAGVVQANPGDPLLLRAGRLYADGVPGDLVPRTGIDPASPFAFDAQADFPGATAPVPDSYIYADIWDRAVTAREDTELMDPGLHGADTCSRTKTMVQIKHCPTGIDPGDPDDNPPIGNAPLDFALRLGVTGSDPCDPCADNLDLDSRVGNYLFRLEVHEVEGVPERPDAIVLKWSRENGAEHHPLGEEPDAFRSGHWVYEFYDLAAECHLGYHPAAGFSPQRGVLSAGWPPEPLPAKPWVRRWDGACRLTRSGSDWSLAAEAAGAPSRDRGIVLALAGPGEEDDHGKVALSAALRLNLEHTVLELGLTGHSFLAGDSWLVAVREAVHEAGDVLETEMPPTGVRHHYLVLGRLNAAGNPVAPDDARRRLLSFPPLTDMHAIDIAIDNNCPKLYDGAVNLQQALDHLCAIDASDIAFTDNCPELYEGAGNLQQALDNLCAIDAADIGFRADPNCTLLEDARTVKEALDALCARPVGTGGGCRLTVGEGSRHPDLQALLRELLEAGQTDICLCLLPGVHRIDDLELHPVKEILNVSMVGCGPGVRVVVEKHLLFLELSALHLEGLAFECVKSGRVVIQECAGVRIEACRFEGQGVFPLLEVYPGGPTHIAKSTLEPESRLALQIPIGVIGLAPATAFFTAAVPPEKLFDHAFAAAEEINAIEPASRRETAKEIQTRLRRINPSTAETQLYGRLVDNLEDRVIDIGSMAETLVGIHEVTLRERPTQAMVLGSGGAHVTLVDNQILGLLSLEGPAQQPFPLAPDELKNLRNLLLEFQVKFLAAAGTLVLRGNRISRLGLGDALNDQVRNLVERGGTLQSPVFRTALLSDNVFVLGNSRLIAHDSRLTNTFFTFISPNDFVLCGVIGQTAGYVGNHYDRDDPDWPRIINATGSSRPKSGVREELNHVQIQDA